MSKGITGRLFKGDKVVWGVFFTLCVLSLIEVFSASSRQTYDGNYWAPITKHALFVMIGVGVAWFTHNMRLNWIKGTTKLVYISGLLMLLYAALGGGTEINSSTRWISIGGYEFQHFEVVKLGIVMIISMILAKAQTDDGTRLSWSTALSFAFIQPKDGSRNGDYTMLTILTMVAVPCVFIFTENLSTVAILVTVMFIMMIIGRVNGWHLLALVGCGVAMLAIGVVVLLNVPEDLKDKGSFGEKVITWKHRVENAMIESKPIRPEDVQIMGEEQKIYSKVAIAEGGTFGKGPGNSVRRDYIPHAYSDYIFAVILEELGLFGGIALAILYLTLLYRCGRIAKECDDPYAAFLVMGIGVLITVQALMHMNITVGNFVTGQPLPLVSQGGTSFLVNCMYVGIILSISRYVARLNRETESGNKDTKNTAI